MNVKKIAVFVFLTFLISWPVAGAMYLLGIKYGSIYSYLLVGLLFMPAPAISALVVQKVFFKQTLQTFRITIKGLKIEHFILVALFYLAFIIATLICVYLLGNLAHLKNFGEVSFTKATIVHNIGQLLHRSIDPAKVPLPQPAFLVSFGILAGIFSGLSFNLFFALGEEIGWRGFLFAETRNAGFWISNLVIGSLWGIWHAPLILLGHNYPSDPYAGSLMMVPFCISLSFLHTIVRLRVNNVFAPAALHGMINAGAPLTALIIINNDRLFGSIVGLAGIFAALLVTAIYLSIDKNLIKDYRN